MVTATIVHNVGGVPGLHIALDGISEAVERRLFQSDLLFGGSPESAVSSASARAGPRARSSGTMPRSGRPSIGSVTSSPKGTCPLTSVPP